MSRVKVALKPRQSRVKVALAALAGGAAIALTACASGPVKSPGPAPQAADPRICAALEPEPDVAGGIVQPVNDVERDAIEEFLSGEFDARAWGRRGWHRAAISRETYCK